MKTRINEFRLQVTGIFGRNRKAKFQGFPLVELPIEVEANEAEIKALAMAKIAEIKVKSGRVKITKTPITVEIGDGYVSRLHEISLLADNTYLDLGTI